MSSSGPMSDSRNVVRSDSSRSMLSVAFWSFLLTQFLGAFNDNYFKQMVLLTCVSQVAKAEGESAPDRQPLALAAFAIPFILLSGLGGFLSDRCAKQRVIVGCKIAEVGIMGVGLMVLLIDGLTADAQLLSLIGVLLLMGAHSAIFAPSKYGVLPELFREEQLLPVNGAVQMTTFLAIIFGTAGAGIALDQIQRSMWIGSLIAMGIAVLGTAASLMIPRTPFRTYAPNTTKQCAHLGDWRGCCCFFCYWRASLRCILVSSLMKLFEAKMIHKIEATTTT